MRESQPSSSAPRIYFQKPEIVRRLQAARVPWAARAFLEEVARRARADGTCRVPPSFFAELFDRSLETIRRWERALERAGVLGRVWRANPEGGSSRTLRLPSWRSTGQSNDRSDIEGSPTEQENAPEEPEGDPRWGKVRRAVRSMGLQFSGKLRRALAARFIERRKCADAPGLPGHPEKSILEALPWALEIARGKGVRRPEPFIAAVLVNEWSQP